MQFIAVRDLRSKSAEVWQRLSLEKEMVITLNGKPIAVLSSVTEGGLEQSLEFIRRARAMSAVESLQKQSAKRALNQTTLEDINLEVTAVRKARKRK